MAERTRVPALDVLRDVAVLGTLASNERGPQELLAHRLHRGAVRV